MNKVCVISSDGQTVQAMNLVLIHTIHTFDPDSDVGDIRVYRLRTETKAPSYHFYLPNDVVFVVCKEDEEYKKANRFVLRKESGPDAINFVNSLLMDSLDVDGFAIYIAHILDVGRSLGVAEGKEIQANAFRKALMLPEIEKL